MQFPKSEFRLFNRGFSKTMVLIPGWATDYRIFSVLEIDYNYLFPLRVNPLNFTEALSREINRLKLEKISLWGWSLGGFLAVEFAIKNSREIEEIILSGVREKYPVQEIDAVKLKLRKNKKACLYSFYRDCFSKADREGWRWFRSNLLNEYLLEMKSEDLFVGLDYLKQADIKFQDLACLKSVTFFHGERDLIAPFEEALKMQDKAQEARFIFLPEAGHLFFLMPELFNALKVINDS